MTIGYIEIDQTKGTSCYLQRLPVKQSHSPVVSILSEEFAAANVKLDLNDFSDSVSRSVVSGTTLPWFLNILFEQKSILLLL